MNLSCGPGPVVVGQAQLARDLPGTVVVDRPAAALHVDVLVAVGVGLDSSSFIMICSSSSSIIIMLIIITSIVIITIIIIISSSSSSNIPCSSRGR